MKYERQLKITVKTLSILLLIFLAFFFYVINSEAFYEKPSRPETPGRLHVTPENHARPMTIDTDYVAASMPIDYHSAAEMEAINEKLMTREPCKWVDAKGKCERPAVPTRKPRAVPALAWLDPGAPAYATPFDTVPLGDTYADTPLDPAGDGREQWIEPSLIPPYRYVPPATFGGYGGGPAYIVGNCPTCCDILPTHPGGSVAVPEPAAFWLLIGGLCGLFLARQICETLEIRRVKQNG